MHKEAPGPRRRRPCLLPQSPRRCALPTAGTTPWPHARHSGARPSDGGKGHLTRRLGSTTQPRVPKNQNPAQVLSLPPMNNRSLNWAAQMTGGCLTRGCSRRDQRFCPRGLCSAVPSEQSVLPARSAAATPPHLAPPHPALQPRPVPPAPRPQRLHSPRRDEAVAACHPERQCSPLSLPTPEATGGLRLAHAEAHALQAKGGAAAREQREGQREAAATAGAKDGTVRQSPLLGPPATSPE